MEAALPLSALSLNSVLRTVSSSFLVSQFQLLSFLQANKDRAYKKNLFDCGELDPLLKPREMLDEIIILEVLNNHRW